jgi:2-polyprenyl-3-methyl-5-hydroxy-6-metoxy-1,4-benzoquinol methylase
MNKDYIASEYRRLHEANKFSGACLKQYIPEIRELIKEYDCKSILDYGCGKAVIHKKAKLGDVTLYDPYYQPYSKKPNGTFDMVICTDVMEHIPGDEVGRVLLELVNYTNKVLFLAICTKPAKKTFKNGKNVHLTIKPKEWWEQILSTAKDIKIVRHYS